jgi:hypothetical protein
LCKFVDEVASLLLQVVVVTAEGNLKKAVINYKSVSVNKALFLYIGISLHFCGKIVPNKEHYFPSLQ